MNRQVDIKALVSHVVRGDGLNKCRICMGDTSEGQVFLSDTVLMEGEHKITLSELLEIISGVEVEESPDLPHSLCTTCTKTGIAALNFRKICLESAKEWDSVVSFLSQLTDPVDDDKAYCVLYNDTELALIKAKESIKNVAQAVEKVNSGFQSLGPMKPNRKLKKRYYKSRCRCKDCGKEFPTPHHLNQHLKMTKKRACTHCGLIVSREKLHGHLQKIHKRNLYHCEICFKLFQEHQELKQHTLTAHSLTSHICSTCKNGFSNERALRAHVYAHSLFSCTFCNSSFENRRCYKYHVSRCKGVKRPPVSVYECDDCGSKYNKKQSLRIHIEQKHINVLPYVCQYCGKRSSTHSHHKAHVAVHMSERKIYQCYCGAKMLTLLGFNLHQRIHTGEKPYECPECGDRFLSASRRLDHIKRRHASSKDMPHACDCCQAKFIRPSQLKKHYQSVHSTSR